MLRKLLITTLALTGEVIPADAQQQNIFITGVPVPGGGAVPTRKNINDLQAAGGPQWDLYIRAMRSMYNAKETDWKSYFQIAGIHGKPFIQWNGGGARAGNGWPGYCPHGESLFLTWHRPFILLFEQVLVEHAQRLAKLYPAKYRRQYVDAANSLRSPYWDWAISDIPNAVVPRMVSVKVPNGPDLKTITMKNPLYTYTFPKAALGGKYGDWDDEDRARMYRCPAPERFPSSANALLDRRPYKQWYDVLTHSSSFAEFASTGSSGASLEQIHNAIHWDAACGGQFLMAEFSAFDPIFWMHHTNVDRLWAYWQAMHPAKASFTGSYAGGSRYSTPNGTRITPQSPLQPFYACRGKFHTSESVKNTTGFGYTYQGLEYWRMSQSQLARSARSLINRIYGNSVVRKRDLEGREEGTEKTTRFFAKVQLDVTEVERPCSVELYVSGKRIGGLVVMQQPQEGIIHGGFSVDQAADTPQLLDSCSPTRVADSITNGLQVEIVKIDGSNIDVSTVPSLKVSLVNVPFIPPAAEDELPEYGKERQQPVDVQSKTNAKALKALNMCPTKLPSSNAKP